jgi:hypothetical protein
MVQVCTYNPQGVIQCEEKPFVSNEIDNVMTFDIQGAQDARKSRRVEGAPFPATEDQGRGRERQRWIGDQPSVVPMKNPVRDIVAPPYGMEDIPVQMVNRPLYPFAASTWEMKGKDGIMTVPKTVETFTVNTNGLTGTMSGTTNYASLDWTDEKVEKYIL